MSKQPCRSTCKWIGYNYIEDEDNYIVGQCGYYCQYFKKPIGKNNPYKCQECIDNKKYNKGV